LRGVAVVDLRPVWVRPLNDRLAAFPPLSFIVAPLRLTARRRQRCRVLADQNRVAEGQRMVPEPPNRSRCRRREGECWGRRPQRHRRRSGWRQRKPLRCSDRRSRETLMEIGVGPARRRVNCKPENVTTALKDCGAFPFPSLDSRPIGHVELRDRPCEQCVTR